jgi:hypothetical protein
MKIKGAQTSSNVTMASKCDDDSDSMDVESSGDSEGTSSDVEILVPDAATLDADRSQKPVQVVNKGAIVRSSTAAQGQKRRAISVNWDACTVESGTDNISDPETCGECTNQILSCCVLISVSFQDIGCCEKVGWE